MIFPGGSLVTISRNGVPLGSVRAAVDPAKRELYFPWDTDVRLGDVVAFDGLVRRVVGEDEPFPWTNAFTGWRAGVVASYDLGPTSLPDLGRLLRPDEKAAPILDRATGVLTPAVPPQVWAGPCKVEPRDAGTTIMPIGEQQLGRVQFSIEVPLEVTDVKVGDLFDVTQSRDGLLLIRNLKVSGFSMSSTSATRELLAFDAQE